MTSSRSSAIRPLFSHSSGRPDVADYGWHDPQLDDDALSEFARSLSGWRLKAELGSAFSYSKAGFGLLGLLLSRVMGTTFEDAVRQQVLIPLGIRNSTFLRSEVPTDLAATPRGNATVGPRGHLSLLEAPCTQLDPALEPGRMCRWMEGHLEQAEKSAGVLDVMWHPVGTWVTPRGTKRRRLAGRWAATAGTGR